MKLTLFINPEHPPGDPMAAKFAEHLEQVRAARNAGYDGIAVGSHLSYGSAAWFPPFLTLARLASEAEGMRIATCMLVLPLYHPLHIAQEAAMLDVLSGGQLTLGVAPGWQAEEFDILDVEHKRRIGRFVEAVEVVRRLWTEAQVDFSGTHYAFEGLTLALKPRQSPRPPLWFGGSVARAVERVAELADTGLGDTWVASSHLVSDVIVEQARVFREKLDALEKTPPADFPVLRNIVVAPDRETAIREAGPYLEASYRLFGRWGLFTDVVGAGKEQLDLPELLAGRVIIGAPEDCAEELAELARATGCTRLIARVQWMGMEQRIVLRTIELLANAVLPIVESELG